MGELTTVEVPVRRLQQWNGAARKVRIASSDQQHIRLSNGSEGRVSVSGLGPTKIVIKSGFARAVWLGEVSRDSRFVVAFRDPLSSIRHRSTLVITDESTGRTSQDGGVAGVAVFALLLLGCVSLLLTLRALLDQSSVWATTTLGVALVSFVSAGVVAKSVDP